MDEVANADGDAYEDLRCDAALQGQQAARTEVQHATVLKLYKYDRMAINMIVDNVKGGLSFCDVAVSDNLEQFNANYLHLTETISQTCQDILDDEAVIVGTSAVTGTELDCIVNQYSGIYTNPFLAWGRYRKGWLKTTLPISFQFHHAQMDGSHAARFLEELQKTINHV